MTTREAYLVELVTADGLAVGSARVGLGGVGASSGGMAADQGGLPGGMGWLPVGAATVEEAHRAPGLLHRAFSVFLRDPAGRVLLQQRSAAKTRFPLRWANTCCGHPAPGEDVRVAAARRLGEELGVDVAGLIEVGRYTYYAEDPATGLVEHEYDHVLLADLPPGQTLRPDPDEVADLRWVELPGLLEELRGGSRAYAPWLSGVTSRLADHLAGSVPDDVLPPDRVLPDRLPIDRLPPGRFSGGAAETDDASERTVGR